LAALLAMNGHSTSKRRDAVFLEVLSDHGAISYRVGAPEPRITSLHPQLQTTVPGLAVEPIDPPTLSINRSWQAWQSSSLRGRRLRQGGHKVRAVSTCHLGCDRCWPAHWSKDPLHDQQLALVGRGQRGQDGQGDGVRLVGGEAVRAGNASSSAVWPRPIRLAQGPSVELGFDGLRPLLMNQRRLPWRWGVVINSAELLGLSGFPLGDTGHLPVPRVRSRLLPTPRSIGRKGYILGEASYPGSGEHRVVALPVADSLKHLHILGATGSGKSTVTLHAITQAMQAGRSVVVIEPKDLVDDVLARIPVNRLDDVVVVDPASNGPIVGFNPLVQPGVPGELIVDQVLSVFKGLFGEAIGPRTQDILTAGLLTLVAQPIDSGARTLVALPLLFTDAAFRARALKQVRDPLGLAPFWAWWDSLSPAEQSSVLAAPMNKIRAFLVRAPLRRTVGQANPKFDLREIFTRRPIVLFNLRRGVLGPETANLLGSLALSMVWQATLGRATVPHDRRHPVLLVADEFQEFTHLSQDFGDVLVQARSLGLGLMLAHQFMGQITDRTLRAAVLSNARSRLVFTVGPEDAAQLVRTDRRLQPEDLTGLGAYQAYAQILTGNETQNYVSLRTLPAPEPTSDPVAVRARSAERWGTPAGEIDQQLERLVGLHDHGKTTRTRTPSGEFGVKKRRPSSGIPPEDRL
jgi:hypothetical protein